MLTALIVTLDYVVWVINIRFIVIIFLYHFFTVQETFYYYWFKLKEWPEYVTVDSGLMSPYRLVNDVPKRELFVVTLNDLSLTSASSGPQHSQSHRLRVRNKNPSAFSFHQHLWIFTQLSLASLAVFNILKYSIVYYCCCVLTHFFHGTFRFLSDSLLTFKWTNFCLGWWVVTLFSSHHWLVHRCYRSFKIF